MHIHREKKDSWLDPPGFDPVQKNEHANVRCTLTIDLPFSSRKKPFLARPPPASTPFKKRNTPMFAAHSPLTRLRLVKSLQNGSKLLCYGTVSPSYFFLFFLIFSYFFLFLIGQPILFFLIFLIFSYFFLFFLFLISQPILFFLIFSYFFLFFLIFSYFFLFFFLIFYFLTNKKK